MRIKNSTYLIILLFTLIISASGCTSDFLDNFSADKGEKINAQINLKVTPMLNADGTRASGDVRTSDVVQDMWIVEYDDESKRLTNPIYVSGSQLASTSLDTRAIVVTIVRPEESAKKYKLFCLANTHNADLGETIQNCGTISDLKEACFKLESEKSSSVVADTDIMLSGVSDVAFDTESLDCELRYNMARLSVSINNVSSGEDEVKINAVTLCNVPSEIPMFDCLYREDGNQSVIQSVTNLSSDICNGETQLTFDYVLPRNMRGQNESTDVMKKNVDAPENASYLLIEAETVNGRSIGYQFYLGKDMVKDFNVEPGYQYNLPIKITGKLDLTNDSRIIDLSEAECVELPESNCYIINPTASGEQILYKFPIIDRINTFWNSADGEEKNVLGADSEWEAEVIWQDCNTDMFEFTKKSGVSVKHFTSGRGSDKYLYFRPKPGINGNVLIGVKKKGATSEEGYLWSWHLWITDYNPSVEVVSKGSGFQLYDVPNGEVLQVKAKENVDQWYMMDRNLGAKKSKPKKYFSSNANDIDVTEITGMYYQYGRKDPFPAPYNEYNCNHKIYHYNKSGILEPTLIGYVNSKAELKDLIKHPNIFYSEKDSLSNSENENSFYFLFKDEDSSKESVYYMDWFRQSWDKGEKNIFDPTPYGYSIPSSQEMNAFTISFSQRWLQNGEYYKGDMFIVENGSLTYPTSGYTVKPHIYFPFAGYVNTYVENANCLVKTFTTSQNHACYLRLNDNVVPYGILFGKGNNNQFGATTLANKILSGSYGAASAVQIRCKKK